MHDFRYVDGKLYCERVSIESLVKKFGTPLYIYSQKTLSDHFQKLNTALSQLDHLICFAMKSNSNQAVLRVLANLGSGFDIASECVFAGVGKTESEIEYALEQGIYSFNVESEPELERINKVAARRKRVAPVAVRVNPNIDAHTHA